VLISAWSLRLAAHLTARTARAARPDPRYEALKQAWGGWNIRAWAFLMIQAATIVILAISVRAAAFRPQAALDWRDGLGALILLAAVAGEAFADRQLEAFRRDQKNRGKVMQSGLWAWSRHPNYFFEWMAWLAWPVIALDPAYPAGWLSLLAPLQMWWLLNHVSGVPMLEAQMKTTRPHLFHDYQSRVSRFFPLPPRTRKP
jgi:steroid 5-alpha reductase family enzyme